MGVVNDGKTTGQDRLKIVAASIDGFEKYRGTIYENLVGSDQYAIDEAFNKLEKAKNEAPVAAPATSHPEVFDSGASKSDGEDAAPQEPEPPKHHKKNKHFR